MQIATGFGAEAAAVVPPGDTPRGARPIPIAPFAQIGVADSVTLVDIRLEERIVHLALLAFPDFPAATALQVDSRLAVRSNRSVPVCTVTAGAQWASVKLEGTRSGERRPSSVQVAIQVNVGTVQLDDGRPGAVTTRFAIRCAVGVTVTVPPGDTPRGARPAQIA